MSEDIRNINKLYSYTSMTEMIASFAATPGWLRVKQGLTLKQEIDDRVKQQDNAATTADLHPLSTIVIEDNDDVKLDDKVRKLQHETENFLHFERYDNLKKKHEWSLVRIDDLCSDWDELIAEFKNLQKASKNIHSIEEFLSDNFLHNEEFLHLLDNRIYVSKKEAIDKLLGKGSYKDIILRPWQEEVVSEMLESDKPYNLLSLAPRFGKTYAILEFMKQYTKSLNAKTETKTMLVPASKNLSSNSSFISDYIEGGYNVHGNFEIISDASLFQDEDILIQKLHDLIPSDYSIIMVTDEADIASHTSISQEKMNRIKDEFNVIKQIAMSGTGIYKAAKIFMNISENDIFFKTLNYTELMGFESTELVKRHFWNVQYDMTDVLDDVKNTFSEKGIDLDSRKAQRALEIFNVNQSFQQASTFRNLSKYLRKFVQDDITDSMLQESNTIMVFVPSRTKRQLQSFVKVFREENKDVETMIVTGDETSNRDAEQDTKDKLNTMKKLNDNRKLVIFSMAMGSRSYSVPQIRRVIIFSDGFINAPWYQKAARCLTYNMHIKGEQNADIIRISFEAHNLASELFLVENPVIDRTNITLEKMSVQLERSSFTNITFKDVQDMKIGILQDANDANDALETALKYTDSTKYIMSQLVDEELSINEKLSELNPHKGKLTSSISISLPNRVKAGQSTVISLGSKLTAKDERALEVYVDIIRLLPYVAEVFNSNGLSGLLELDWKGITPIPKNEFIENMKNERFDSLIETMFRNVDKRDAIINEKMCQFNSFL